MKKRFLAILLVLAMCFSLLPLQLTALAEEEILEEITEDAAPEETPEAPEEPVTEADEPAGEVTTVAISEEAAFAAEGDGEETAEAVIGDTGYATLAEAMSAAAAGDTIVLTADEISLPDYVRWNKAVTIDLNGHTVIAPDGKRHFSVTASGTLMDSVGTGKLTGGSNTTGGAIYVNGADVVFTMEGGTIENCTATGSNGGGAVRINAGAFVMNGGTITKCRIENTSASTSGYSGGAVSIASAASATINGGTITNCSSANLAAAFYNTGSLTVNGGTITDCRADSNGGAFYNTGSLTITGGTVSGCTAKNGAALYNATNGTVAISGGTFGGNLLIYKGTAAISGGIFTGNVSNGSAHDGAITVTGGWFKSAVSAENNWIIPDGYYATGALSTAPDPAAPYTVAPVVEEQAVAQIGEETYASLAEAVSAATSGDTITLLTDLDLAEKITIAKQVTIDGGSHTIYFCNTNTSGTNGRGLQTNTNGDLTLKNLSLKGHSADGETAAANDLLYVYNGTMTLENVTIAEFNSEKYAINGQSGKVVTLNAGCELSGCAVGSDVVLSLAKDASLAVANVSGGLKLQLDADNYTAGYTVLTGSEADLAAAAELVTLVNEGTLTLGADGKLAAPAAPASYVVSVTSGTETGTDTLTTVTGGGEYASGTEVTVTAASATGYDFLGWYESADGSAFTPVEGATDLSYTFTLTADITLKAVFRAAAPAGFNLTVCGTSFTVNGSSTQRDYEQSLPAGSKITLSYSGSDTFLYWTNANGKILSTSPSYSFTLTSAMLIRERSAPASDTASAMVMFTNGSSQILSSASYTTDDTIAFPAAPSKLGKEFSAWSMTEEQIKAAMAEADTVTVDPVFISTGDTYDVTVVFEGVSAESQVYEGTAAGKYCTVTAPEQDGCTFLYWKLDSAVISYSETCKIVSTADITLTAVYGTEPVEKQPMVSLIDISGVKSGDTCKLRIVQLYDVPAGYTLVESGVLVATSDTKPITVENVDGSAIRKGQSKSTDSNAAYVLNLKVSGPDAVNYLRGYLVYSDGNNTVTVYSDTVATTYNQAK